MIMSTKEICKRGLSMTISLTLGNTPLPLAHCLGGHMENLGKPLLGQALFLPGLGNEPSGLLGVHGLTSCPQYSPPETVWQTTWG